MAWKTTFFPARELARVSWGMIMTGETHQIPTDSEPFPDFKHRP
ncbi:hypothetical protein [Halobacillus mangrovi]